MSETLFVTTNWLNDHLQDDNLRIIDIRGRVLPATEPPPHYKSHGSDYDEAHIPGAVFVDWTTDIVEPGSPSYDVANPERYAALMSRLGIDANTQVVAYDDANGMFAARLWWTLRYYGHEQVAVLDGGWQKWIAEDRPVTSDVPHIAPTEFVPHVNPSLRVKADDILQKGGLLLDVRSGAEFAGEASRASRMGHIPGAVNLPRKAMLDDSGHLLAPDTLKERFDALGIDANQDVIVYCNSGVSASFGLMALEAAGLTGRVYDGSWKDWANDPEHPIE